MKRAPRPHAEDNHLLWGRKNNSSRLEQNLEALDITLVPEQIPFLESETCFDVGFPVSMIVSCEGTGIRLGLYENTRSPGAVTWFAELS
ncbi:hypothetical protein E1B28_006094 [Marasmius oreades]|uniref:Uncharacterized protein n=1 Tax=Marasmius oreades TaxID=181124 RepID=A0A9P7UWB4_9AGAR|nr:uncharacterized protein E1B28_006094 [Marasmius oreades]KAG7095329.1 hypothetical protein E1B28_006094 [Marasmius oreades]